MEMIAKKTMRELVELFNVTTKMSDKNISTVRGWIMDEIEKRNPIGFDKWLDSEDCADENLALFVL